MAKRELESSSYGEAMKGEIKSKNRSTDAKSQFVVRFVLHDNSSFEVLYEPVDNAFTRGYGNDTIYELVMKYAAMAKKVTSPSDQ